MDVIQYLKRASIYEAKLLKKANYSDSFDAYYNSEGEYNNLPDGYDTTTGDFKLKDLAENEYPAPRLPEIVEWLLYEHNIYCDITFSFKYNMWTYKVYKVKDNEEEEDTDDGPIFSRYIEALHAAILNALYSLLPEE
jgi:hypothetical protein